MSQSRKNPFVSDDDALQKVTNYADARFFAGEYSVAVALFESLLNLDKDNFYVKLRLAASRAQCEGKEYDGEALTAWSDALFAARDAYFAYAGATGDFAAVIGREIGLFESVALVSAKKAKNARIVLANSLEKEVCELKAASHNSPSYSYEVQKMSAGAAKNESSLVSFTATLVSAYVAQLLGYISAVSGNTDFEPSFYEEIRQKALAHRGKWHIDTRELLKEAAKESFDTPVCESEALFVLVDRSIDKICAIADESIKACKAARYAKYWAEHPDERKALEDKKAVLEEQLAAEQTACDGELAALEKNYSAKAVYIQTANKKCADGNENAAAEIERLKCERNEISLFDFKARMEIRRRIKEIIEKDELETENTQNLVETLESELFELDAKMEKLKGVYKVKKDALEAEIAEIEAELTRERA